MRVGSITTGMGNGPDLDKEYAVYHEADIVLRDGSLTSNRDGNLLQ